MVARRLALRSTQVQAVSVRRLVTDPHEVCQSTGHPDQAVGVTAGGRGGGASAGAMVRPCGSPGVALGGPTVPGGTDAGSLLFGVSSGGRMERESQPTP